MAPKSGGEYATRTGENEFTAKLQFGPGTKRALASVFNPGPNPPAVNAMMEFFDNSVAFRRMDVVMRIPSTYITVSITDDSITVRDEGEGTDQEGIGRFLVSGASTLKGISALGAGGKSAIFFFGNDLTIRSKKRNSGYEYSSTMPDFGNPETAYEGKIKILRKRSKLPKEDGFFEVTIGKLRETPKVSKLTEAAAQIYRPLLIAADGDTSRRVVNREGKIVTVHDKIVLNIDDHGTVVQVDPQKIPLIEGSEDDIKIVRTDKGEPIWYWCGQKDEKADVTNSIDAGLKFYYDGRLITSDFLGHSSRDPRLKDLVGEVHLDHIEGIKDIFSLNKTGGINKTGKEWHQIIATLRQSSLGEYIEQLLKKPIQIAVERPDFFDTSAADVQNLLRDSIKALPAGKVMTKAVIARLRDLVAPTDEVFASGTIYRGGGGGGGGARSGSVSIPHSERIKKPPEKKGHGFIKKIEIEKGDGEMPFRFIDGIIYLDINNPLIQIRMQDQANTMVLIGEVMADVLSDEVDEGANKQKIKNAIIKALGANLKSHPAYQRHFHVSAQ